MPSVLDCFNGLFTYSVKQSDRNSSKTDLFHKPSAYEQHSETSFEKNKTFARHEYGRVEVFRKDH